MRIHTAILQLSFSRWHSTLGMILSHLPPAG
jgi:hypothetical protein